MTNLESITAERTESNGEQTEQASRTRDLPPDGLNQLLPDEVRSLQKDIQHAIPRLAKDPLLVKRIESAVQGIPTHHTLLHGDSRELGLAEHAVDLVVTSPPYWTLKDYPSQGAQLGLMSDYSRFLQELGRVWGHCLRALVPGGRLVCVVGDVCLARRRNGGVHAVIPLHAAIQQQCTEMGFTNLAPIIWYKIANAQYEAGGATRFLGKPYEPNAVIKNDVEFILMFRKPGGYRRPSGPARLLSVIGDAEHKAWFQQIWTGLSGASTREHPAPFPLALAERLVRMFSFAGDTVLDPFMGTGTTSVAAARWGRNSIGVEVNQEYAAMANARLRRACRGLACTIEGPRTIP